MPLRRKNIQAELKALSDHDMIFGLDTTLTIAQINNGGVGVGTVLLPAIMGAKYRLIYGKMIAIGGAAATQPVLIRGTQAAALATLWSQAVAGLTQNTLVPILATILAAGASFNACDVNTAIFASSAGVTGATSIRFILEYAIERNSVLSGVA